ncbi:MAG: DUF1214 domain-containing protein [Deltaproteobacteria bacterium]|nr:DUF1214 domain-containing protein [Deltaproteobacteria bacterium]MBW2362671.1 DUF1214 domain-containing protein [Deltaproteobacteria bacterium]
MADRDADRLMSGEAWREFCDRLKAAGDRILEPDFPDDGRTRTEGFRALLRLLSYSTRLEVEAGDPLFPDFVRYEEPHTQWGGPNPDNTYLRARIDPTQSYRIWANVAGMHGAIFCQHEGDMQLEQYGVYHECDMEDFETDAAGHFELVLSPQEHEGNWIPTHPKARLFTIRIYLSDWQNHSAPTFHIERVGAEGVAPPPVTPGQLACGLERVIHWVEKSSVFWNGYVQKSFAAATPNVAGEVRSTPGGADNIAYGSCFWDLADDEALLLTCEVPVARYWNFTIHTMTWLESGDFPRRQTSLTGDQVTLDGDGLVRIVLSKEDPGVPNWIDSEGRPQGLLAYRWVWAKTMPTPTARVVKVADVFEHLPADHGKIGEAERCRQLSARREALWNRYG